MLIEYHSERENRTKSIKMKANTDLLESAHPPDILHHVREWGIRIQKETVPGFMPVLPSVERNETASERKLSAQIWYLVPTDPPHWEGLLAGGQVIPLEESDLDPSVVYYRTHILPRASALSLWRWWSSPTGQGYACPSHELYQIVQRHVLDYDSFVQWHTLWAQVCFGKNVTPMLKIAQILPATCADWNGSKGASDTIKKFLCNQRYKPTSKGVQAHAVTRMIIVLQILVCRQSPISTSKSDINTYPSLPRWCRASNKRSTFFDTLITTTECFSAPSLQPNHEISVHVVTPTAAVMTNPGSTKRGMATQQTIIYQNFNISAVLLGNTKEESYREIHQASDPRSPIDGRHRCTSVWSIQELQRALHVLGQQHWKTNHQGKMQSVWENNKLALHWMPRPFL